MAVKISSVTVFKNLWEWAKERQTTDELNTHKLSLAKNLMQKPAWHNPAETKITNALDILWECSKGELTTEELSNKMLLAKDDNQKKSPALGRNDG